jgi:hypothetical protein
VAGGPGVPAASGGVVAEGGDVGELGRELQDELQGCDVVVALLGDVGVEADFGGELAEAVAVRNPGVGYVARSHQTRPGMISKAGRGGALLIASS